MSLEGIDVDLNMVRGFLLRVSSIEMKEHCTRRAAYHQKRADDKESELPQLKQVMETLKGHGKQLATTVSNFSKGSSYNLDVEHPVENLEKDILNHRNKAVVFEWFADHLLPQDYLLDESALVRLEILKQ